MEIDIYIDSLTDCLICNETDELHDTEYRLVCRTISKYDALDLKAEGWKFDWHTLKRFLDKKYKMKESVDS